MTKKALTLSIVIPVYNDKNHLKACLESIKKQTLMPHEVIVVDNNSTDGSAELARGYQFVQVISESRQGIAFARNKGFNSARGDLIGRIDADSQLASDWVEKVYEVFLAQPHLSAVTGDCYFYDFRPSRLTQKLHSFGYYTIQSFIARTQILWGSNMVITSSAWQQVQGQCSTSNSIHEDIDLSLKLPRVGLVAAREKSMRVGVSMRRGFVTPKAAYEYMRKWSYTYWKAGRRGQAVVIGLWIVGILALLYVPYSLFYVGTSMFRRFTR